MDYFPLFADLKDRPVLIIGAGQVASRKMTLLRKAGANITLVAPQASTEVRQAHERGEVTWCEESFTPEHLSNHVLVISATNDDAVNQQVSHVASAAGRLCNVVDDPRRCSFITPAIVDRGAITIAISSGGRSPTVTRWVKAVIERALPARIEALVALASRWRTAVKRSVAPGQPRQRLWLDVFSGPIADHALAGRDDLAERAMTRRLAQQNNKPDAGIAWLVGAGAGDADLMTLRGARLLSRADVVLYDALVDESVLELARRDATFIHVGKRAGAHAMGQDQINEILVQKVRAGKRVCRLKGGDPLVFGRGGEEALALRAAGLSFEIVPGITAAAACGAYAGIPLTHRGVADSVSFVTATGRHPGRTPDYADLAAANQTVVFYMGARALPDIARGLMAHGRAATTPVGIVQNGARSTQSVITTTLGDLQRSPPQHVARPACVIVGEVVALHNELAWFDPQSSVDPRDSEPQPLTALLSTGNAS